MTIPPGGSDVIRLRLSDVAPGENDPFKGAASFVATRQKEADQFYDTVIPHSLNADEANVMRQALAGMLWSKQYYHYDVDKWLEERGCDPFKANRRQAPRNDQWHHMYNGDIISMPDKWEYPWYAAWDLAFHVLALTLVDPDFGKQQLKLMLRTLHASQWTDSGLRMELWRCQSAGTCLVHDFHVQPREGQDGARGPGLAQEQLSEVASQFHLVGQSQGPLRQEHLRRRFSGTG